MKTKCVLTLMCVCLLTLIEQNVFAQENKTKKDTVVFYVEDMECKNCQAKVEKNIAFEKGVLDIKCDLETKTVQIMYKTDKTDPDKLAKGFKKIGMEAVVDSSMTVKEKLK